MAASARDTAARIGGIVAGLLVGVVRGITVLFYPPAAEASMYILMILVLLFRPRGLMGERFEMLEETLQIVHQMWSDDTGPFTGQHYQLAETLNVPQSLPHPTAAQLCFRIE